MVRYERLSTKVRHSVDEANGKRESRPPCSVEEDRQSDSRSSVGKAPDDKVTSDGLKNFEARVRGRSGWRG
jgi:hypothetical protein